MSTQSDYDNAVQSRTAQARRTLFMIAPIEAWTKTQMHDAAVQAARSAELLAEEFDGINEFWLTEVEKVIGPLGDEAWSEIKAAYHRVQIDVVAPALKAKAAALKDDLPSVDPNAEHRLNAQTQGVVTGRGFAV